MRLLVCDKISESTLEHLKQNIALVDYIPDIPPQKFLEIVNLYDALLIRSRTKITTDVIFNAVKLKVIGRAGTGVDNIDINACKEQKIKIVNAPDANSISVAEVTINLILTLLHQTIIGNASMREGRWLKNEIMGSELYGRRVGVVGWGKVGKRVADLVSSFGAKVFVHSRSFQTATLKEIFEKADIITLHLSLNPKTEGLVSKDLISLMKPSALLVNTARAQLIDEEALFMALKEKKIAGAALDVFWQEPLPKDSRWLKLENIILTPHTAGCTDQALDRASLTVASDIIRVLKGEKPKNIVT